MHVDRPFESLGHWTGDSVEVVGPDDERLAEAAACIVGGRTWDAAQFDLAPNLVVLARTGIGFDAVDLAEATRRKVMVVNTPEGPTVSTAEHTVALMFSVAKTIGVHQQRLREASGNYHPRSEALELDGLTLGLVAFGRIARRVARIADGIGMSVIAHDPFLSGDEVVDQNLSVELVSLEELLSRSDVVSLHAPLAADTHRLVDAEMFSKFKPGAIFLNAARGGLVDHDALVSALDSGRLSAAGLDVTDPEPLDQQHTLLHRDNVVVTPHVASATGVGRDRMLAMAIEQALVALKGDRPSNLLNVDVA